MKALLIGCRQKQPRNTTVSAYNSTDKEKSKREFIKESAVGMAGLLIRVRGVSSKSYVNIIGDNDRINVAVVGLGLRLDVE